jgi:hypothetical protein
MILLTRRYRYKKIKRKEREMMNNEETTKNKEKELKTSLLTKIKNILNKRQNKIEPCLSTKNLNDILKDTNLNDYNYSIDEEKIYFYMDMNGVIEKEKLQSLLKENHNIDLSINQLDKIIKEKELGSVLNNLYSIVPDISQEEAEIIFNEKKKYNKYKEFDENLILNNMYFKLELDACIESLDIEDVNKHALYTTFSRFIYEDMFNLKAYNKFIKFTNLPISKKQKKDILNILKKYKNIVSIWKYNGFTLNDVEK